MQKVETLGNRLRQIMLERSLNYEALGQVMQMKPQTLNRYVLGQREPKAVVVMEMAQRLGVDDRWLQGYDVPQISSTAPGEVLVPIVGTIRAGSPEYALEDIEGWAPASISAPEGYFYLRVKGDSMINAGIFANDLILMQKQSTAENGDIIACLLEGDSSTLKRYRRQGDFVILQPENPAYEPRILPIQDFELGVAVIVGVARQLRRVF